MIDARFGLINVSFGFGQSSKTRCLRVLGGGSILAWRLNLKSPHRRFLRTVPATPRRSLGMAVRTKESEILHAHVSSTAVDVIKLKGQRLVVVPSEVRTKRAQVRNEI